MKTLFVNVYEKIGFIPVEMGVEVKESELGYFMRRRSNLAANVSDVWVVGKRATKIFDMFNTREEAIKSWGEKTSGYFEEMMKRKLSCPKCEHFFDGVYNNDEEIKCNCGAELIYCENDQGDQWVGLKPKFKPIEKLIGHGNIVHQICKSFIRSALISYPYQTSEGFSARFRLTEFMRGMRDKERRDFTLAFYYGRNFINKEIFDILNENLERPETEFIQVCRAIEAYTGYELRDQTE